MLYCCAEELRARAAGKPPGPQPWLRNLVRRLEMEVALSSSRQDEHGDMPRSDHDDEWIGTVEAARILHWHQRQVQRRAADLEARKVAGKLVFRAATIHEYAEALKNDDRLAS
jgi:hypothetical protein